MILFEIYCNFFIALSIRLKTCRFNGFLQRKICAAEKSGASLWARNLSRPEKEHIIHIIREILICVNYLSVVLNFTNLIRLESINGRTI